MDIFEFSDLRRFLGAYLTSLPNNGRGELGRIARALEVHPSLITVILKGEKQFTLEQGNDLCDYLKFTELEADFFLILVQLARAGKPNLIARLNRQLQSLKRRSRELKERLPDRVEMSAEAKAVFYSQWYYSGIRMLTQILDDQSPESIASRLQLPRPVVVEVIQFLLSQGLLKQTQNGFALGPSKIHVASGDPLVFRHHMNWRQKALAKFPRVEPDELHFTGPLSISRTDAEVVRAILLKGIDETFKIVDPSPSEEVFCLNIDWFRF